MLADVLPLLRCPHCASALTLDGAVVRCPGGHAFDVARQGYVTLSPGRGRRVSGDTAAMLAARDRVLGAGHFAPIVEAVAEEAVRTSVGGEPGGGVVDVGAGTGHYLAAVLDRLPGHVGLALDASKYAARRAARVHARAGAVVCDVGGPWPVRDGVADVVLDVFSPRHGSETARVLRPRGVLVVVTPTARHLREVREPLGLLAVDPRKQRRVEDALAPHVRPVAEHRVRVPLSLGHGDLEALAGMGPTARHVDAAALHARSRQLATPVRVTAEVDVRVYRRPEASR